jgi:orotidine-5'-phosphate decarboxylase
MSIHGENCMTDTNSQPFEARLRNAWAAANSLVCVGLDPDLAKLPACFTGAAQPIYEFNKEVIDATYDLVCAYKPQIAFYSAARAERELELTIEYIRQRAPHAIVILDSKRGDIGNTASAYAAEAFDRYRADAVTINPYMGEDSVRPFIQDSARAAIVLCRTSNSGARDFQNLLVDGKPLYRHVAARAARHWNQLRNVLLVVGATYPEEMGLLRKAHPEMAFLVPGIGAQGGDLKATLDNGLNAERAGLLISSSRQIIFAGEADAIRAAAQALRDEINRLR